MGGDDAAAGPIGRGGSRCLLVRRGTCLVLALFFVVACQLLVLSPMSQYSEYYRQHQRVAPTTNSSSSSSSTAEEAEAEPGLNTITTPSALLDIKLQRLLCRWLRENAPKI